MEQKKIPEFFGLYEATTDGQILSFTSKLKGNPMKQYVRKDGYVQVQIRIKQKSKNRLVHILVDRAFNGEIPKGYEINHKDGNKQNNSIENLERVTRKENIRHAIENKLWNPCSGEKHPSAKLKNVDVIQIKELAKNAKISSKYKYGFFKETAQKFNVHPDAIKRIARNKTWKTLSDKK
jgi:hypothetical protein